MRNTSNDEAGRDVVRMRSPADLQRWSERLGVTPVELKVAVGVVGPQAAAVRRYLQAQERPTAAQRVAAAGHSARVAGGAAAEAALGGGAGLASAKSDKPAHGGDERPRRSSKRRG